MLIVSFDGGGVRGLVAALLAREVEIRAHGASLNDSARLLAGASTGAIVAAALALDFSPDQITRLYRELAERIFPGRLGRWAWRLRALPRLGPSAPRYDPGPLEAALQERFEDLRLGDLRHHGLYIPTYDLLTGLPYVFQSWRPEHQDVALWEVLRATSAAQTYFPAHVLEVAGRRLALVDGGTVANNPTTLAIAAARARGAALSEISAISFGTGKPDGSVTAEAGREWGLVEWAPHAAGMLLSAGAEAQHLAAEALLGDRYVRLQVELPEPLHPMDRGDPAHLERLAAWTIREISARRVVGLERAAALLSV